MTNIVDFNTYKTENAIECTSYRTYPEIIGNRNILYILVGIPNAGKTTYAYEYLRNLQTVIISSDEIRNKITGTYKYIDEDNPIVFDTVATEIRKALSLGFNAVQDATNLHRRHRKRYVQIGKEFNCYVVAILFKTPPNVCMERNKNRDIRRKVPVDVIERMSRIALSVYKHEGYDEIITVRT